MVYFDLYIDGAFLGPFTYDQARQMHLALSAKGLNQGLPNFPGRKLTSSNTKRRDKLGVYLQACARNKAVSAGAAFQAFVGRFVMLTAPTGPEQAQPLAGYGTPRPREEGALLQRSLSELHVNTSRDRDRPYGAPTSRARRGSGSGSGARLEMQAADPTRGGSGAARGAGSVSLSGSIGGSARGAGSVSLSGSIGGSPTRRSPTRRQSTTSLHPRDSVIEPDNTELPGATPVLNGDQLVCVGLELDYFPCVQQRHRTAPARSPRMHPRSRLRARGPGGARVP